MTILVDSPIQATAPATEQATGYAVVYDRSAKQYSVVSDDGEIAATFPAGSKDAAERFVIGLLDPTLAAMTERMVARQPQLEAVAWRGAALVARNAVSIWEVTNSQPFAAAVMKSEPVRLGQLGWYGLQPLHTGGVSCECDHYIYEQAPTYEATGKRPGTRRVCKHIAAYYLHLRTRMTDGGVR